MEKRMPALVTLSRRAIVDLAPKLGIHVRPSVTPVAEGRQPWRHEVSINVMNWVQIAWMVIGFFLGVTVFKGAFPLAYRFSLKVRFWLRHGRKGKMVLFVYSDSSNWKDYIETNILPRIEAHSIILNWSKRREWESSMQFEARLFNQWAGSGEFTPTAILFPLMGKVRVFRLWQPSHNPKHGKDKGSNISKEAEQSLFEAVKHFGR